MDLFETPEVEPLVDYYENGQLKRKGKYKDGELDGLYEEYYENGFLKEKGVYFEGEKKGTYVKLYQNGVAKSIRNYQDDEICGFYTEFYKNGRIKENGYLSSDGCSSTSFYESGEIKLKEKWPIETSKYYFLKSYEEYYRNGQLKEKGSKNEDGNLCGPFEKFYKNGQLKERGTFEYQGLLGLAGSYELYYKNGHLKVKGNYKILKDGLCEEYYENGQLKIRAEYKSPDKLGMCGENITYEDGELIINYSDGQSAWVQSKLNGKYEAFYEGGQSKKSGFYKNGIEDGILKEFYENGQLKVKRHFFKGKLMGNVKVFFESGNLKSEGSFKNGIKDGYRKEFYENGQIKETGNYNADTGQGEYKIFYKNGRLMEEGSHFIGMVKNTWGGASCNGRYYVEENGKNLCCRADRWILCGQVVHYHKSGKVKNKNIYSDGVFQKSYDFDENSKLIE